MAAKPPTDFVRNNKYRLQPALLFDFYNSLVYIHYMDEYELLIYAVEQFDSASKAIEWINTRHEAFGGVSPLEALEYFNDDVVERVIDDCF